MDLLILLTFMLVFAATMLPDAMRSADWRVVFYAVLSLTVARMLPVALSLMKSGVGGETIGFIGWFGPRGTASILYLFSVIEAEDMPNLEVVYSATLITVLLSVFAHGMSAAPGARWYGRIMSGERFGPDAAEAQPVPVMPIRWSRDAENYS